MAQRSHVPKFGNWEGEESVPYTVYFEKARKGRNGGKMINPNDPEENPDLVPNSSDRVQHSPSRGSIPVTEEPTKQKATKTDSDLTNRRASNESAHQRYAGRSVGSDYSIEQSPLHPKARASGRGPTGSPSWEGGKGSYESSHGTPGRSRLRPRGDESPDKGAAVPKFGEWDENNPASADGYTHIFNKVREERQTGAGRVPGTPSQSSYSGARRHSSSKSSKCSCFPWGRK